MHTQRRTTAPRQGAARGALAAAAFLALTDRGDGRDDLAQLQLVQDGRLARSVEADL